MLLGHEVPRIYTPPLRELTPETTLGYEMCEFAEALGFKLVPWERWLLVHAFEILGSFDGDWSLRFRTVLVLISRQQGKTFLTTIITLYFLYILCVSLIIGTAQELDQAEEAWDACVDAIQSDDELSSELVSAKYGNSGRRLKLTGGRRYITKASSRKAGRGKRAQLVIIDELREQTNWEAWNAISSTTLAQAQVGMLWCTSNAGDPYSRVLRHERFLFPIVFFRFPICGDSKCDDCPGCDQRKDHSRDRFHSACCHITLPPLPELPTADFWSCTSIPDSWHIRPYTS